MWVTTIRWPGFKRLYLELKRRYLTRKVRVLQEEVRVLKHNILASALMDSDDFSHYDEAIDWSNVKLRGAQDSAEKRGGR